MLNILVHQKVEKTVQDIDCYILKKLVRFFWINEICALEQSSQRLLEK